ILADNSDSNKYPTLLQALASDNAQPSTSKKVSDASQGSSMGGIDGKYPTLLRALTSGTSQATASEGASGSKPAFQRHRVHRRHFHVKLTGKLFSGIIEASKRGVNPVLKYPIPGGEFCYAFELVRTTKQGIMVYRCTGCRKNGTTTSIAVQNGCEFIGDPVFLQHVCVPWRNAQDSVTRMVYQSCQAIASEPQLADAKPSQLWKSIAQFIDDNAPEDERERKEMLKYFYRGGYKSRRRTIARAAAKLHRVSEEKEMEAQEDEKQEMWISKIKDEPP
uniref:T5orf172 domain-containing protein n=1 Tax=Haemonchus contortus TaxID=6289 RepID=A0A7I4Y556_HAECO